MSMSTFSICDFFVLFYITYSTYKFELYFPHILDPCHYNSQDVHDCHTYLRNILNNYMIIQNKFNYKHHITTTHQKIDRILFDAKPSLVHSLLYLPTPKFYPLNYEIYKKLVHINNYNFPNALFILPTRN